MEAVNAVRQSVSQSVSQEELPGDVGRNLMGHRRSLIGPHNLVVMAREKATTDALPKSKVVSKGPGQVSSPKILDRSQAHCPPVPFL